MIGNCPASNSGCCCHVMALIWKLEDMTRKSQLKISVLTTDAANQNQGNGEKGVDER